MALQYRTSPGVWATYTAGTTSLPAGSKVLHFRDTALAITGASPSGTATTGTITLSGPATHVLYAFGNADAGTVTGGAGILKAVFSGVTYAANTEPFPAISADAGTAMAPRTTADANEYGAVVGMIPESFIIRVTGLTYSSATTINVSIEVHLV